MSGPFAAWLHHHRFLEDGAGGTILRDEFDYEPPVKMIGRWLGGAEIRRRLDRMFTYRQEVTKWLVEASSP